MVEGLTGIPIVSTLMMLWVTLAVVVVAGALDGQYSLDGAPAPAAEPAPEPVPTPAARGHLPIRAGVVARALLRAGPRRAVRFAAARAVPTARPR